MRKVQRKFFGVHQLAERLSIAVDKLVANCANSVALNKHDFSSGSALTRTSSSSLFCLSVYAINLELLTILYC